MKFRLSALFVCIAFSLFSAGAIAGDPASDRLNAALNTWRIGDVDGARSCLTELIDAGTEDPRVYYFRGILLEQTGQSGDSDFGMASRIEAETSSATRVNRALERIQGPLRARIEKFRAQARNVLKADPEMARQKTVYREALEARRLGNLPAALAKFEDITSTGGDPRFFYMYGVTLAESGDADRARTAFSLGLEHETTPADIELVNIALAGVQGGIRRMIEEQTTAMVGDQLVTRQKNRRNVQRRSALSAEDVLAAANAAEQAAADQARRDEEARRLAAADKIIKENREREAALAALDEKPTPPPVPGSANSDPPTNPPEPPAPTVAATTPNAPANPFLGGGAGTSAGTAAVSSVSPGPIDTSYLPAAAEYLMYIRPGDVLNSRFARPLTDMPEFAEAMSEAAAQAGMTPQDIDSVTIGVSNLVATMIPIVTQAASGGQPDPAAISQNLLGGGNTVIVIRLTKDVDLSALMQIAGGTEVQHEGSAYYLAPKNTPEEPQMAAFAVDARTVVVSGEDGVKAAISNGPGEATNDQFEFVSRSSHVVMAVASPLLAAMSTGIPDPGAEVPPPVQQLVSAVKGKIAGGAIVLEAGRDLTLNISLNLTEDSAAAEAESALQGGLEMAKQFAPLALGGAPQPLQPPLQQIINSLSSSSSSTTVTATVKVPGSLVQALKDNPEVLGPIAAGRAAAGAVVQQNNLKQIALAMHNYHDVFNHFPAADGNGASGNDRKSGLSWRVHILPFIEQQGLYEQFNLDEPWDSAQNKALIPFMPEVFTVPGVETPGETSVHVFTGENTVFDPAKAIRLADITDGTSNTIMAVVAGPEAAVPWTKPGGLLFNSSDPAQVLGTVGELLYLVLCDGSVRSVSPVIDPTTLSNLIQRNDGNVVQLP